MRWVVWFWLVTALAFAQPAWQKLESHDGRFIVSMPGVARSSVVPLPTSAGSLKQFQFLVDQGSRAFMVTYLDYPEATVKELGPDKILNNMLEGIKKDGGSILQEAELEITGTVGHEVFYRKNMFYIHSRLMLVGNRLYQLTLAQGKDQPDPDARRFFDSFRFTP